MEWEWLVRRMVDVALGGAAITVVWREWERRPLVELTAERRSHDGAYFTLRVFNRAPRTLEVKALSLTEPRGATLMDSLPIILPGESSDYPVSVLIIDRDLEPHISGSKWPTVQISKAVRDIPAGTKTLTFYLEAPHKVLRVIPRHGLVIKVKI